MISTKKSVIILFWQEPSIFLRINLFIDDVLQIIVKSIIFKTRITVLNFIERDPTVNYYHKALHSGCYSCPRCPSADNQTCPKWILKSGVYRRPSVPEGRGGSRAAATSKMECFLIYIYSIVNFEHVIDGWEYPVKSIKIVKGKVLFMESFLTGETLLPRRQKHIELYSKHFSTAEKFRFPLFCL